MTFSIQKDALLSKLSVAAYKDISYLENRANLPTGWKLYDASVEPPFAAFAFKSDSTGEVVIAYRGTDGLTDLVGVDKAIATGGWDRQFKQATDFASRVLGLR